MSFCLLPSYQATLHSSASSTPGPPEWPTGYRLGVTSLHAYFRWRNAIDEQLAYVYVPGKGVVPLGISIFERTRESFTDEVVRGPFPFGPLSVGSGATKEFWVTNRRPEEVLLGDLSTAGVGLSAPFSVVGGTCLDQPLLPPDFGQCSLRVRFAPTALGAVNDSIDVRYRLQTSGTAGTVSHALSAAGVPIDPITSISAGVGDHVCALLASGNVRCWGAAGGDDRVLGYTDSVDYGRDYFPNSAGNVRGAHDGQPALLGQERRGSARLRSHTQHRRRRNARKRR